VIFVRDVTSLTTHLANIEQMPYLHWETHTRQQDMARIIDEETQKQKRRKPSSIVLESARTAFGKTTEKIKIKHAKQLTGLDSIDQPCVVIPKDSAKVERSKLAEYLLQITKVYDAMDIEADERILRDNLYQESPLHPRRTLDQSHYWKLPDTRARDSDQVVYRETESGTNVLRTSRVIMVDQLWLYILDDRKSSPVHSL
jgi:hypothetical protein